MNKLHSKYPSIGQFRQIIKDVHDKVKYVGNDAEGLPIFDRSRKAPILTFTGAVKLHGTNAGIKFNFDDDDFSVQSRTNIITPEHDNAGFAAYVHYNKDSYLQLFKGIKSFLKDLGDGYYSNHYYGAVIYGEWCAGNIQKNVGINGLPKMFVVFGIKILSKINDELGNVWLSDGYVRDSVQNDAVTHLYNIFSFPTYSIDIDFEQPEQAQNQLIEYTNAVEKECPVAKAFGVSGGTGEGIVWTCYHEGVIYRMKVKGEAHSISKVKVLAPVDIERVNSINELVLNVATENRFNQGLDYLRENHIELCVENTGAFIKWVNGDIIKEELDLIVGSGFDTKAILGPVSRKAKTWFFEQVFS